MAGKATSSDEALTQDVLTLLDENRVMCLATVRPDGWPQATMVGYIHDDITLYFAVARTSQKLANIQHDQRVSIAIGHDTPKRIRGLSMSAKVSEVTDPDEIDRINALLHARYPEQAVFAPREAAAALLKAVPKVVSIVDLPKEPGRPQLVMVEQKSFVRPAAPRAASPGAAHSSPQS
jgi:general stress protein 26